MFIPCLSLCPLNRLNYYYYSDLVIKKKKQFRKYIGNECKYINCTQCETFKSVELNNMRVGTRVRIIASSYCATFDILNPKCARKLNFFVRVILLLDCRSINFLLCLISS